MAQAVSVTRVFDSMTTNKIEIYTSPLCGYCHAAKQLLAKKKVQFQEYSVIYDTERRQEMLSRSAGRHTVPQIFINDVHVGGYDDLTRLEQQNELDALLATS